MSSPLITGSEAGPGGNAARGTYTGARSRFPCSIHKVRAQLETRTGTDHRLGIAGYFLIVWDIVRYCKESNIMVQGRGSAANSAVCYSLGITYCDPLKYKLLFERFLSEGRKGSWPDIDLDLPSGDKREQVIQEIYRRYGADRRGHDGQCHHLPRTERDARGGQGARPFTNDVMDRFSDLFPNGDFPHTIGTSSSRWTWPASPAGHRAGQALTDALPIHLRVAASPGPAFGRHDHLRGACSIRLSRWKTPVCRGASSRNGTRTIARTSASSRSISSGSA